MKSHIPQKGKVCENNSCLWHKLISWTFHFCCKYFPILTTSWWNKPYFYNCFFIDKIDFMNLYLCDCFDLIQHRDLLNCLPYNLKLRWFWGRNLGQTLWKKEKMLVARISFFTDFVFYPVKNAFQFSYPHMNVFVGIRESAWSPCVYVVCSSMYKMLQTPTVLVLLSKILWIHWSHIEVVLDTFSTVYSLWFKNRVPLNLKFFLLNSVTISSCHVYFEVVTDQNVHMTCSNWYRFIPPTAEC